ncbi:hypothetical protein [Oscillatoria sp. FACHB-1406]|uniref:hypothetical protein n=1 Tax=Oscillatoria sp. FACHB-1406 TaxID=2692846 RepID=UPI001687E947|nr:hypothetical protein [Oscillatoria sp. FACHB-1406]MBD2580166.1 hypothetical protein [Oscillatoria sp. FACHB-1406]
MKRLLEQLDAIEAIVDTVSPARIESDPQGVRDRYQTYVRAYRPLERVEVLREHLLAELEALHPVNGYLSADYGYGKTATLVYLWHSLQQAGTLAVPPFKFRELGDLIEATYGWMKACLKPEFQPRLEALYGDYALQSRQVQAAELARKYKLPETKALKIVRELKSDVANTDRVLNFWRDSVPILREAGFKGLCILADESQEFLRTEEGASVRIQLLSDLVKGMRALGNLPVALIFGMPTSPTESAIAEQASDIIHRMKEQKVCLRLADADWREFPSDLWEYLRAQFLDSESEGEKVLHPATMESLGQLCDRKDLSNGPRTVIEIFKRAVRFASEQGRSYTPLDLIEDYLAERVQFYGAQQQRINKAIEASEQIPAFWKHPHGKDAIALLAIFPNGVSDTIAAQFNLLESIEQLAADEDLYGSHIVRPTERSFALASIAKPTTPSIVEQIVNRFRQQWFQEWSSERKESVAVKVFRTEILPLLFSSSKTGQRANWTWRYRSEWKQDRSGFYNILTGAPERYKAEYPNRSLMLCVGTERAKLMGFVPPEKTHLDWRFHLHYAPGEEQVPQQELTAIAGTNQVDFSLHLSRSFERRYPLTFGLLGKAIPPEKCSACTLLNLSDYIQNWLLDNSETNRAEKARLEYHRQQCHQYALRLLLPTIQPENWSVRGITDVKGGEAQLIESIFTTINKRLFPNYQSFYSNLHPSLIKYKIVLKKVPLVARRGYQSYQVLKPEFEQIFEAGASSLPSFLSTLKQHQLVKSYKIGSQKEDFSSIDFAQHPLEAFIQEQLETKGKLQAVETSVGSQEVKALALKELREAVLEIGYLYEEFEEALEWLKQRRYCEQVKGIIRQTIGELEPEQLKEKLNQLHSQISELLEAFNEPLLREIERELQQVRESLASLEDSELSRTEDKQMFASESAQLNLLEENGDSVLDAIPQGSALRSEQQYRSNVLLEEAQSIIQRASERIEKFCREKRSTLGRKLAEFKLQVERLTRELLVARVEREFPQDESELEPCLNEHRLTLERKVKQLEKACNQWVDIINTNELDLFELQQQFEKSSQSLQEYEQENERLKELVAGLEEWRIILPRAAALRQSLSQDLERLARYEDDFVDRVVTHFATHKIEGFREYERLQRPLVELEEQIKSERRSRRDAFNCLLNQYEAILERISSDRSSLSIFCRFDDDNRQGSYETLKQVFSDKVQQRCDRFLSQWDKLERDLIFLAQERDRDVTKLLAKVSQARTKLRESREELPLLIEDMLALEDRIEQISAITEESQKLQAEFVKLEERKDENLTDEEQEILAKLVSTERSVSISQLRQLVSGSDEIWEKVKDLYRKGHLNIMVKRRD